MQPPLPKGIIVENARINLGAPIVDVPVPKRIFERDMKVAGSFAPTIAFSEERPVSVTLEVLATTVTRVLRQFDPLL